MSNHLIVVAEAGSHLYGLNGPSSDEDTMGLFISSPSTKLGFGYKENIGQDDDVKHELMKFVKLAVGGNPTVLQLLYTPQDKWRFHDPRWTQMQQDLRELTVSERCRTAFLGYLQQQRKKLTANREQRKELIEKYGYDTKFAMHMLRLGIQGLEMIRAGKMTLPIDTYWRSVLMAVREGKWDQDNVLSLATTFENELMQCATVLPPDVDYDKINAWIVKTYREVWGW